MIRIVTDTTSGITPEMAESLGVGLIPQIVVVGDDSYRDDTELDTDAFLEKLRTSPVLPKTAAPPPSLYGPIFDACQATGDTVICLHPSAKVSGTVRSATVAKQDYPDADIRVVDTQLVAGPLGSVVKLASQWARDGLDAGTIVSRVEELSRRVQIFFVVDTLEYLHKGGRIGLASALVGSLLQIKPILCWEDGQVASLEQQRTSRRALARLRELVEESCPHGDNCYLSVNHVGAEQTAYAMANELARDLGISEVPVFLLPPAIVVHAGPGTLAIGFFTAPD
jgi:fatty acid kinase fatty acid binding subunit